MNWKIYLALLLTLVSLKFCQLLDWNDEIKENIEALGIPQTVPNMLERFYAKWSQVDACLPQNLKSFEVQVKKSRHPLHDFRIQIAHNNEFFKAELWIEFYGLNYGILKNKIRKRKYVIDIKHGGSGLKVTSLKCDAIVTKRNLVEISCDMTAFYTSLSKLGEKFAEFSIYLHHRKGRGDTREFQGTTVKAFVVLYEKNKACTEFPNEYRPDEKQLYFHPQKTSQFLTSNEITDNRTEISWRVKREANPKLARDYCSLKDWYPSFEEIGFRNLIVAPSRAAIYMCTGECVYWKHHLTNYAMLRMFYAINGIGSKACCVPTEYGSLTLVQYDPLENMIVVTQYSDMIAKSCGCY